MNSKLSYGEFIGKIFWEIGLLIVFSFPGTLPGAAQTQGESWTGGFWLEGNWITVDVRFNDEKEKLNGTADVVFPSYSNSVSARGVNLNAVKSDSKKIGFEIPFNNERIVFRGQIRGKTISGKYEYATAKGDFGLTRITELNAQTLEKYYGVYRVSPNRVISVFRSWSDPRTVWFVDYQTGQVGTLYAESEDNFFTFNFRLRVFVPHHVNSAVMCFLSAI